MAMTKPRHSSWSTLTWRALLREYRRHRKLPFVSGFGPVTPLKNGRLPASIIARRRRQGREAATLLRTTLERLRRAGLCPSRPARLTQVVMDRIRRAVKRRRVKGVTARGLHTFWEALIITRAAYECEYCGRNANAIHRERRGRTAVRMVVDHEQPPRRGGTSYTFANSVPACWSCNHLKSGLPRALFEEELLSLASAVMQKDGHTGGRRRQGQ
jgi:5-methylcytosine-specific restriction endonuclease McrA